MTSRTFKGSTFKRCTCRHPDTRKQLGATCPKLKRSNGTWSSNHGTWSLQAELPHDHHGKRRTRRRGGFASQTDAQAMLDDIARLLEVGGKHGDSVLIAVGDLIDERLQANEPLPAADQLAKQLDVGNAADDAIPTVGDWLLNWLSTRKVRKGTRRSYLQHIESWLVPYLGHYRLDLLTSEHIARMFDAMAERNDTVTAAKASDDPAARAGVRNLRVIGPATMQRYRATLRAALNAAIRNPKIPITFNPASYVELESGKRPKALLWTPGRVEQWQQTGVKPSRVMVWTPEHTGRFLDHAEGHPYYVLFHLIAYRGLRRGEACGLPWWEVDFANQSITISKTLIQIGWHAEFGEPKSDASGRIIALDVASTEVLQRQKSRQNNLREATRQWVEHGLVCTEADGSPVHPAKLTDAFHVIAEAAGLPPVRLHDLRHGAATLALAAGADLKTVQELLGHSTIAITADTYTHVLPELARETAEATAQLVPRRNAKAGQISAA